MTLHGSAWVECIVETERTSTVRVALELLDGGLRVGLTAEANDTRATRAAVWLVLDLSAVDGTDGLEELDKVLVAGTPWQLLYVSVCSA